MKMDELEIGVNFTRCSECDYKRNYSLRDDLLITAGARAAYMHDAGDIELPEGVEGERQLAVFVAGIVDLFLGPPDDDTNFDDLLETLLMKKYAKGAQDVT